VAQFSLPKQMSPDVRLDYGDVDPLSYAVRVGDGSHRSENVSRATRILVLTSDKRASTRPGKASSISLSMLRGSDVLSDLLSSKCVAARDLSRFQAGHKPTGSLSRSAVSKCIGYDVTLGPPLQAIISDGRSGLQRRFDITRFDELPLCLARFAQTPARQSACSSIRTCSAFASAFSMPRCASCTLVNSPSWF
jgi:hypothetical protein